MLNWMLEEVQLFKGISPEVFNQMAEWIVENEMWPKRRADVLKEIDIHRRSGVKVAIVSGAYQPIVDAFAMRMDAVAIGSPIVYRENRLVGLQLPINAYEHKAESIQVQVGDAEILAAYGDTLSDLPMLEMSQEPVGVSPDKKMRKVMVERGWRIIE